MKKLVGKSMIMALACIVSATGMASEDDSVTGANSDYIRGLKIVSDSSFDGRIYSNSRMQAELIIVYELLDEGDSVTNIELRRLYTGQPIGELDWRTQLVSNGYYHSISNYVAGEASEKSEAEGEITGTKDRFNAETKSGVSYRYVTKSSNGNIDVCVSVETNNGHYLDTCDATTIDSYIALSAVTPVIYDANDYDLSIEIDREQGLGQSAKGIKLDISVPNFPGVNESLTTTSYNSLANASRAMLYNTTNCCDLADSYKHVMFVPYADNSNYGDYITFDTYVADGDRRRAEFSDGVYRKTIMKGLKLHFNARNTPSSFNSAVYYNAEVCQGPKSNDVVNCWRAANTSSGAEIIGRWTVDVKAYHDSLNGKRSSNYQYIDNYGTMQSIPFMLTDSGNVVFNNIEF
ncbi:hypothetical protein [Vibrio cyclitrophicus]|uniref:Hemolysin n=2 Tax=Vibrio cyclitrophicus TaxID=47951 RepID=A0A7Z1S365_9VIBR|nr:hypothetical protein [Vibrio cyclitrophicus]PMP14499.1 hypothetical protein BCS91_11595 [Vibrio cyclitrophicus]PMP33025.1 hypothetical protein BCS90_09835 [Vibrio cyclitrophicus]